MIGEHQLIIISATILFFNHPFVAHSGNIIYTWFGRAQMLKGNNIISLHKHIHIQLNWKSIYIQLFELITWVYLLHLAKKYGYCGITKILPLKCMIFLIFHVPVGGPIKPKCRALTIYDPWYNKTQTVRCANIFSSNMVTSKRCNLLFKKQRCIDYKGDIWNIIKYWDMLGSEL